MGSKRPVTILQELCSKTKASAPFYEELPEQVTENGKLFKYQVSACGRLAQGCGSSKKEARHHAAALLLEQMEIQANFKKDAEDQKQNAPLRLWYMCYLKNWPWAEYTEIQTSGPSHCPEFICRCTLSTITREASASTKKGAKQKVALAMLQVIETMIGPEKFKVIKRDETMDLELEEEEKILRIYKEHKKLDCKKQQGVKLCDRHNFYVSLDPTRVEQARQIFLRSKESLEDKVRALLDALNFKFKIAKEPSYDKQLLSFELKHINYDSFFVEFEDKFWQNLAAYFVTMLDIPS